MLPEFSRIVLGPISALGSVSCPDLRTIPSSVVAVLASASPDITVEFNSSGLLGTAPGMLTLPLYPTRLQA